MRAEEHYAEAERLIGAAKEGVAGFGEAIGSTVRTHADLEAATGTVAILVALAQVHATLATGLKVTHTHHNTNYYTTKEGVA